mmetsp:Transcript_27629/g.68138  ORF Transcript_27629/g.68138 Transcript_27629/m.68138 type:complete len:246 (-) Transcript_27629:195-932(-)
MATAAPRLIAPRAVNTLPLNLTLAPNVAAAVPKHTPSKRESSPNVITPATAHAMLETCGLPPPGGSASRITRPIAATERAPSVMNVKISEGDPLIVTLVFAAIDRAAAQWYTPCVKVEPPIVAGRVVTPRDRDFASANAEFISAMASATSITLYTVWPVTSAGVKPLAATAPAFPSTLAVAPVMAAPLKTANSPALPSGMPAQGGGGGGLDGGLGGGGEGGGLGGGGLGGGLGGTRKTSSGEVTV